MIHFFFLISNAKFIKEKTILVNEEYTNKIARKRKKKQKQKTKKTRAEKLTVEQ